MAKKNDGLNELAAQVFRPGDAAALKRLCLFVDGLNDRTKGAGLGARMGVHVFLGATRAIRAQVIPIIREVHGG